MRVKTDLKAGNLYDSVSTEAQKLYEDVLSYLQTAGQSVEGQANAVSEKAKQVWNCITS